MKSQNQFCDSEVGAKHFPHPNRDSGLKAVRVKAEQPWPRTRHKPTALVVGLELQNHAMQGSQINKAATLILFASKLLLQLNCKHP